jgi:hypothetical protein
MLLITTITMVFPCKFYNTEKGCRSEEDKCGHPHVLYCTNEICVKAEKQHTHTRATCGQKGGGAHEAFIAKKREASMAEKAKKKAEAKPETAASESSDQLAKAKNILGEKIYKQVTSFLTDDDNAGYNKVTKDFPVDLPANRLAGKIVGMLLEGLDLEELINLVTNATELAERMAEAVGVLHTHKTLEKPAEA